MNDHLNLLPMTVRRQNRLWLRLRQWGVVWTVVAAVCVTGTLFQTSRIAAQRFRLSTLEAAVQPLRTAQQEHAQKLQRLNMLRSRESLLAMLERMEQPVQLLGIVGRSVGRDRPEVQVYDLVVSPTQIVQIITHPKSADTKTNPATPTTRNVDRVQLKIDGYGIDDLAVAHFVAGLREAGVFESVALKSSIHVATLPGEGRQFTVECVFQ